MNFLKWDQRRDVPPMMTYAALNQKKRYAGKPESAYAVTLREGLIHPAYEGWVRGLIDAIGRRLKAGQ